jgi:hypothetical protein
MIFYDVRASWHGSYVQLYHRSLIQRQTMILYDARASWHGPYVQLIGPLMQRQL